MIYLANAYSIHMLPRTFVGTEYTVTQERISAIEAGNILKENDFVSAYGHLNTVKFLARYLHMYIPCKRRVIKLEPGDTLIIAAGESKRDIYAGVRPYPQWTFWRVEITEVRKQNAED